MWNPLTVRVSPHSHSPGCFVRAILGGSMRATPALCALFAGSFLWLARMLRDHAGSSHTRFADCSATLWRCLRLVEEQRAASAQRGTTRTQGSCIHHGLHLWCTSLCTTP